MVELARGRYERYAGQRPPPAYGVPEAMRMDVLDAGNLADFGQMPVRTWWR